MCGHACVESATRHLRVSRPPQHRALKQHPHALASPPLLMRSSVLPCLLACMHPRCLPDESSRSTAASACGTRRVALVRRVHAPGTCVMMCWWCERASLLCLSLSRLLACMFAAATPGVPPLFAAWRGPPQPASTPQVAGLHSCVAQVGLQHAQPRTAPQHAASHARTRSRSPLSRPPLSAHAAMYTRRASAHPQGARL